MNVLISKARESGRGPALALLLILAWGGSAPSVERAMTISELARVADVFLKGMILIYARFLEVENPEIIVKGYMDRLVAARDWLD